MFIFLQPSFTEVIHNENCSPETGFEITVKSEQRHVKLPTDAPCWLSTAHTFKTEVEFNSDLPKNGAKKPGVSHRCIKGKKTGLTNVFLILLSWTGSDVSDGEVIGGGLNPQGSELRG